MAVLISASFTKITSTSNTRVALKNILSNELINEIYIYLPEHR